ncbi:MAG: helix-turn-helix transcriptional regulator [Candidatus Handelsmanbacteria bacterium]|nr:helix-turn-helix transcriptional regulator [Candidatus Handelsmanbacteria bacterium]
MPRITPLKLEIVKRRLVQADLAETAGIDEYRLSRIVNGRVKPTEYERKNLAQALGMRREELPV